jgi:N-acyl-D-amino-acid deacylase
MLRGSENSLMHDIVITGGTVIDGTGAPGMRGDVAIANGLIAAIGDLAHEPARRRIDAAGKVVCPGFIDIHTHYDAQVLWDRMLTISPWHGVTTAVLGNCGFGLAPARKADHDFLIRLLEKVEGMPAEALVAGIGAWDFETFQDYLVRLRSAGVGINVAAALGHTPLRRYVMGEAASQRAARPDEIGLMCEILREALAQGAIGFSTSRMPFDIDHLGRPVPSRFADGDELGALAAVLREKPGSILLFNVGRVPPWDEFERLARISGGNLCWSFFVADQSGPDAHREGLRRTADQIARGLPIFPQTSCKPIVSTWSFRHAIPLVTFAPFAHVNAAQGEAAILAALADQGFRAGMRQALDNPQSEHAVLEGGSDEWAMRLASLRLTTFADVPGHPELTGANVWEIAARRGAHPIDLMLDLAVQTSLGARFTTPMMNYSQDAVAEILADPNVVLGLGDGGAHFAELNDACYPTWLLGHWVRERGALSLERAVHMLTGRPADVFAVAGRGRIAPGYAADIVVFDPQTVASGPLEHRNDLPGGAERLIVRAVGIEAVLVNGIELPQAGTEPPGELPGRVLGMPERVTD